MEVYMISIGVDFGGTNIKIGIMQDGKIISKTSLQANSHKGIVHRLGLVEEKIKILLKYVGFELKDCSGIGIAIPGIVNFKENRVLSINDKYKDALSFDFAKWNQTKFSLPLVMDNDANLALLGEVYSGCALGAENAVMMTLGTGIGTAAIIEGRLLRGKNYQAGCLGGHFTTMMGGRTCTCGNIGCVEAQAGSWAIPAIAIEAKNYSESLLSKLDIIDVKNIIISEEKGDEVAKKLLAYLVNNWAVALVNLIHAYDPELIVLSGGVINAKEKILNPLIDYVYKYAWTPWGKVKFVVSENPDESVLLGLDYLLKKI